MEIKRETIVTTLMLATFLAGVVSAPSIVTAVLFLVSFTLFVIMMCLIADSGGAATG